MKRSDLICENGVINNKEYSGFVHNGTLYRTKFSEIIIDSKTSELYGKAEGRYITVFCNNINYSECLCELLESFIEGKRILVAGLGNERICSDSLGAKTLRFIPATAHLAFSDAFKELNMREVYVIETSVTGKTGMESIDQIGCIAEKVNADMVIVIDSLACSETERLCNTIQITDAGISPGSGVGNDRKEISRKTLGRKIVAIGVPTVIDYKTENSSFMVTPRNIDIIINEFSKKIGKCISRVLNPSLSDDEISSLIIH